MLKDDAPRTIVSRAAPMAFIDDDEVKEIRRIVPEKPRAALLLCQRLIDGKIHLPALNDLAGFDLVARVAKRGECLILWVVNEDVAIRKEEDARLAVFAGLVPAARPELPANLEGNDGFARSCRHREQQTFFAGEDGFDRPVDGNLLVVSRRLTAYGVVWGDEMVRAIRRVDSTARLIALPQVVGRRKIGNARFRPLEIVDLDNLSAVGGVGVFETEDFRIITCLLHSICHGFVAGLCLDHSEREISRIPQ